jgi:hypothetical protein
MDFGIVNYGKNSTLKNDTDEFSTSEKPLKYYVTNWYTTLKSDAGINSYDGYVSPDFIDKESGLKRSTITNPRVRQNFGELPHATTGGLTHLGPVISEEIGREKRSCQPFDSENYKRSFYELKDNPNHVESVDRQGTDTRQQGRSSAGKQ